MDQSNLIKQKTYFIKVDTESKGVHLEYMEEIFRNNQNWRMVTEEEAKKIKHIDFSYIIGRFDNSFTSNISYRFNTYHRKYLTNKSNLYKTIEREEPENYKRFMVYHTDIDIHNLYKYKHLFSVNKIFILRPTWSFERSNIELFDNFDKFKNFINKHGKQLLYKGNKKEPSGDNRLVLSEYIKDLLLFNNRVFDLRVYLVISLVEGVYRGYFVKPIIMNLGLYERSKTFNIDNLKENITNPGNDDRDYFFTDLEEQIGKENGKYIINQIKQNLTYLFRLIKKFKIMRTYPDQKNVYELFGLDFIVDNKYNVKFVEFNEKTGLGDYEDFQLENIASSFIYSTVNKLYSDEYKLKIDDREFKDILRVKSNKNYL
jgi:hypothetical protein